jgi:hypothetical protein
MKRVNMNMIYCVLIIIIMILVIKCFISNKTKEGFVYARCRFKPGGWSGPNSDGLYYKYYSTNTKKEEAVAKYCVPPPPAKEADMNPEDKNKACAGVGGSMDRTQCKNAILSGCDFDTICPTDVNMIKTLCCEPGRKGGKYGKGECYNECGQREKDGYRELKVGWYANAPDKGGEPVADTDETRRWKCTQHSKNGEYCVHHKCAVEPEGEHEADKWEQCGTEGGWCTQRGQGGSPASKDRSDACFNSTNETDEQRMTANGGWMCTDWSRDPRGSKLCKSHKCKTPKDENEKSWPPTDEGKKGEWESCGGNWCTKNKQITTDDAASRKAACKGDDAADAEITECERTKKYTCEGTDQAPSKVAGALGFGVSWIQVPGNSNSWYRKASLSTGGALRNKCNEFDIACKTVGGNGGNVGNVACDCADAADAAVNKVLRPILENGKLKINLNDGSFKCLNESEEVITCPWPSHSNDQT